jgi:hypothetical protein
LAVLLRIMARLGTSSRLLWQPLTLGGVAGFAHAPLSRLLAVASFTALFAAASVAFFFLHAWAPALERAISQLPDKGEIRDGKLDWTGPSPVRLVSGAFVSIIVDPSATGGLGEVADVQCEFNQTGLRLRSLLGYVTVPYPAKWTIPFNRVDLQPWWGAWLPALIAGIVVSTFAYLWAVWSLCAVLYLAPIYVIAFYMDRPATLKECWKLGIAASMPGALLMSLAIVAYSFYQINLIQFLMAVPAHLAVTWIYVVFAPLRLPRPANLERVAARKNPFRESRAR